MILQHKKSALGFTLVELMLSMAFISVLLLAIAMLVLQISSTYNKGLTLRAVNEAGQLITSDIQRTVNQAVQEKTLFADDTNGGRFCVGTSVYAWNYGPTIANGTGFNEKANGDKDILLVKFESAGQEYCVPAPDGTWLDIPNDATDMLASGETNLALHTFSINEEIATGLLGEPVENDPLQRMYAISLTIGTNETGFILANRCTAPASRVDDEYCSVNTFNFVARTGSESEG